MKTIFAISILTVLMAATTQVRAQDYPDEYLGLPGDNFNLYAVMNLFQESETLEGFERSLNDENSRINNLDLNGDNYIDYIAVSDYEDGNIHTIVLRAVLGRNEYQDVAVFTVEKFRNGAVQIQLIGDEALYGKNYIIEPIYAETPNPGYTGKPATRSNVTVVTTSYYDIAAWPVIRFMYRPGYVVWRSSWYWGYYPVYWHPWTPYYWHYYYGYHYHWYPTYYAHYHHWDHYRCKSYKTHYYSKVRVYSPTVVVNVNKGHYRNTYSRPDQRSAGEALYARTYDPRKNQTRTVSTSQRTQNATKTTQNGNMESRSTNTYSDRGQRVTTEARNTQAVSRSTNQGNARKTTVSTNSRSTNVNQGSVSNRTSQNRSTPAVKSTTQNRNEGNSSNRNYNSTVRNSSSNKSTNASVQRNSTSRNTTPAVQRSSNSQKSSPSVQHSSNRNSSPAVQRSSSSRNNSPAVQRSSNSSKKSSPAQRSSNTKSKSSSQKNSKSDAPSNNRPSRR